MRGVHAALAVAVACATCLVTTPVAAQDSSAVARGGWLVGGSVGVPGHGGEFEPELFTVGVHWTHVRRGRPGVDFSLGTVPRVLIEGLVVMGARAGVAVPVALSPTVTLLPSGGVSVLGGFGGGGGGGTGGYNIGAAVVMQTAAGRGLRTGVTWHWLGDANGAIMLVELGLVRVPQLR